MIVIHHHSSSFFIFSRQIQASEAIASEISSSIQFLQSEVEQMQQQRAKMGEVTGLVRFFFQLKKNKITHVFVSVDAELEF